MKKEKTIIKDLKFRLKNCKEQNLRLINKIKTIQKETTKNIFAILNIPRGISPYYDRTQIIKRQYGIDKESLLTKKSSNSSSKKDCFDCINWSFDGGECNIGFKSIICQDCGTELIQQDDDLEEPQRKTALCPECWDKMARGIKDEF